MRLTWKTTGDERLEVPDWHLEFARADFEPETPRGRRFGDPASMRTPPSPAGIRSIPWFSRPACAAAAPPARPDRPRHARPRSAAGRAPARARVPRVHPTAAPVRAAP